MTSDLALPPDLAPAPTTLFYGYSRDQVELAKRTLMPDESTDDELHLFLATAQRMGLDPFVHQIRAIRRSRYNSRTQRNEAFISIEPGIDGLRLVAERTHEIQAEYGPYWCGPDGKWVDVWLSEKPPAAAKFGVLRKGRTEPRFAVALWREYRQTKSGGGLTSMWENRPAGQLAKCAEALCKRAVFPHELGGIYTSDEMAQADNATTVQAGPTEVDSATGEVLAERTQEAELWADDMPTPWAIDNVRDPEDARWLLQQPEVSDDYRAAVKKASRDVWEVSWASFWRNANFTQWRETLLTALALGSDPGSSTSAGVAGDATPGSPGSDQTSSGAAARGVGRIVAPEDPTSTSPSTLEQEEATGLARSRVEGANHKDTERERGGGPPSDAASTPPGATDDLLPRGRRPPGGHNRPTGGEVAPKAVRGRQPKSTPAAGRATTEEAGQAAFDQDQAGDDPGRFAP